MNAVLLLLCSLLFALSGTVLSAPASPFPVTVFQPDGTPVQVIQKGDEWVSWFETEDGYPVVKDKATGAWYYAYPAGSTLVPTSYRVGDISPEVIGVPKGVKLYPANPTLKSQAVMGVSPPPLPHTQKVLVIAVNFANIGITTNLADITSAFFSAATAYTIAHYFATISRGKMSIAPASESEGTANDGVVFVSLSVNHPECQTLNNTTCNLNIVRDALAAADNYVNFAAYDTNNDGVISPHELAIVFLVAGYESASSACQNHSALRVWAHMFGFSSNPPVLDGKSVPYYAMFGEKHCINTTSGNLLTYFATIGIIIHELSHLIFGLPDLYDTDSTSEGIGPLGVMGAGLWGRVSTSDYPGTRPVFPTAWTLATMGFMTLQQVAVASTANAVMLSALADTVNGNALKILSNSLFEFFIASLRTPLAGTYDEGLKGFGISSGGVVIWHVLTSHYPDCVKQNNCNNDESRKLLDMEEADGKQDLDSANGTISDNDFFTDAAGRNKFDENTNPSSKLYDGGLSGVSIIIGALTGLRAFLDMTGGSPSSGSSGGSGGGGKECNNLSPIQSTIAFSPLILLVVVRLFRRLF